MSYKNLIKLFFIFLFLTKISFAQMTEKNAYQFSFNGVDNKKINFADFKGKVIMVVNSASKCGFTPQYQGLESLYQKYKDRGLVIIGVPSNDFANQEFAEESEVEKFVEEKFHITFPLTDINKVKGANAHQFYLWANKKAGIFGSPKWNFHKYIIDRDGNLAAWFSSPTKPESQKIINKIEELLVL